MKNTIIFFWLCILIPATLSKAFAKSVPLNDPNIHVLGAGYVYPSDKKLFYGRFSPIILALPDDVKGFNSDNARTNSGIRIMFKTNSNHITLTFALETGANRGSDFAVLQNGIFYRNYAFKPTQRDSIVISIKSVNPGKAVVYEIVLPSFSATSLVDFNIDNNAILIPFSQQKKIYLAFGDSITHGTGQIPSAYKSYPYLLSKELDVDYYNLAVGGAKISLQVAEMSKELPMASIATVLIGYNDLVSQNKKADQFITDYRIFLDALRKSQPVADVFCISLLYTKTTTSKDGLTTPDEYRIALKNLIEDMSKTDKKLFFIPGDKITSAANLQPLGGKDPVHLTETGAALFADTLYKQINAVKL